MQSGRVCCVLLLAAAALLSSCGGGTGMMPASVPPVRALSAKLYATSSATTPSFAGTVRIANRASTAAKIGISIDGQLFRDKDEMLAYIATLPPTYDGEPDYRKAWRFLTARGYFYTPYTGSDEAHDPLRFVNSVGYGYCDDFASVLAAIWQWQGHESRVWWMTGHVVPEVRVNARWMMFDADFGVFYSDGEGEAASVEELEANPQLIVQPIAPLFENSYLAYDAWVSNLYATADNNRAKAPAMRESRGMQLEMPPGSELVFPVKSGSDESQFADATLSHPVYYEARLSIPAVAHDTVLRLPLFVLGIWGVGQVEIDDRVYDIGSAELDARFEGFWIGNSYTEPVSTVTLHAGASGVVIRMMLSAFVVDGLETAHIRVDRQAGPDVVLTYTPFSNRRRSSVSEMLAGVERQVEGAPIQYVAPQRLFWEMEKLLEQ